MNLDRLKRCVTATIKWLWTMPMPNTIGNPASDRDVLLRNLVANYLEYQFRRRLQPHDPGEGVVDPILAATGVKFLTPNWEREWESLLRETLPKLARLQDLMQGDHK
jgi:4-aminobutyrate aminotransferase-like enzyme